MVVLEASQAAIPVVAFAVGGVPDLLGDVGGWLVAALDTTGLAAGLDAALSDRVEASRRAIALRTRLAARETAENWIDRYSELYSKVLAELSSGRDAG